MFVYVSSKFSNFNLEKVDVESPECVLVGEITNDANFILFYFIVNWEGEDL